MTAENFCYWAHGFFEIGNPEFLTKEQVQELKNHLTLVLNEDKTTFWYPENLRKWNEEHPDKPLIC